MNQFIGSVWALNSISLLVITLALPTFVQSKEPFEQGLLTPQGDCSIFPQPEESNPFPKNLATGKKLWVKAYNEEWIIVYRKQGEGYVRSTCFSELTSEEKKAESPVTSEVETQAPTVPATNSMAPGKTDDGEKGPDEARVEEKSDPETEDHRQPKASRDNPVSAGVSEKLLRGITVDWEPTPRASGYEVSVKYLEGVYKGRQAKIYRLTTAQWTETLPKGRYEMSIRAVFDNEEPTEWSEATEFLVKIPPKITWGEIYIKPADLRRLPATDRRAVQNMVEAAPGSPRPFNYVLEANYFLSMITYEGTNYDSSAASLPETLAGTGQLGARYYPNGKDYGWELRLGYGGMLLEDPSDGETQSPKYLSLEAGTLKTEPWMLGGGFDGIVSGGVFYREAPEIFNSNGKLSVRNLSVAGAYGKGRFAKLLSDRFGFESIIALYSNFYGISSPTEISPTFSFELAALGTMQVRPRLKGLIGLTFVQENYSYVTEGNASQRNEFSLGGVYVRASLEYDY